MQWAHIELALVDWAQGAVEFAANWLLQSTVLILAGLAVGRLLLRQGSAVQSVVFRTTLVSVLLCPLLTWAISTAGVSGWPIEMRLASRCIGLSRSAFSAKATGAARRAMARTAQRAFMVSDPGGYRRP